MFSTARGSLAGGFLYIQCSTRNLFAGLDASLNQETLFEEVLTLLP